MWRAADCSISWMPRAQPHSRPIQLVEGVDTGRPEAGKSLTALPPPTGERRSDGPTRLAFQT